jgi:hypothetical protein
LSFIMIVFVRAKAGVWLVCFNMLLIRSFQKRRVNFH